MNARFPPEGDDWWMSEMGKRTCKKCGEDKMTHSVTDFRGEQVYCPVCANSWWAVGKDKAWSSS